MIRELEIPGRVTPKARPRFDPRSGRAYTEPNYRDWLDMASDVAALTLRKPGLDGPVIVRCAFTGNTTHVAVLDTHPTPRNGQRGDIDNLAGAVMDALQQGGVILDDSQVVRLETWFA